MFFTGLQKVKKDADKRFKFGIKKDIKLERKLRDPLNIRELVYIQAERLKMKDAFEDYIKAQYKINPFLIRVTYL